jgi:predicted DNA-binding transcriptional regulator AlpA
MPHKPSPRQDKSATADESMPPVRLFDLKDCAAFLRVSVGTVRNLIRAGRLHYSRNPGRRSKLFVDLLELERFVSASTLPRGAPHSPKRLLSAREVEETYGLTASALRELRLTGKLVFYRIGRSVRYQAADIERYISSVRSSADPREEGGDNGK